MFILRQQIALQNNCNLSAYSPLCSRLAFIRLFEIRSQNQKVFLWQVLRQLVGQIFVSQLPIKRKRNNHVLKLRQNYVRTLRQINVRKLRNKFMKMGSKNYVVITFGSYVMIWLQKSRQNYVRKLRQISVRKLCNKTMQMGSKNYVLITF